MRQVWRPARLRYRTSPPNPVLWKICIIQQSAIFVSEIRRTSKANVQEHILAEKSDIQFSLIFLA